MSSPLVFAGSPLDRAGLRRRDPTWIAAQLEREDSRFLPFWKLNVLVKAEKPELAWATGALRELAEKRTGAVLLGVRDEIAHFALDLSPVADPVTELGLAGAASFVELRAAAATLSGLDAAIAAQGRQMLDWHARHRFCAVCGRGTSVKEAGYMRECDDCDAQHFPRTDPVVIMLVESGDRCLLGRQAAWPPGMFSALAGFVEAGESLEEAVRREVLEEAGVRVGAVRYFASQPWPFPSSLMIGCIAHAESSDVTVDKAEIQEARWFTKAEIARSLATPGAGGMFVPPPLAIAHHLIRHWAES
ncbi:MAG TPA: NAD(+) diphosphatase [Myxococcota bacterium]|nr:NAD(+) diphosphatase [Myxococcota bacterium]